MNDQIITDDIVQVAFLMARGFRLETARPWAGRIYRFTISGRGIAKAAGEYVADGLAPIQQFKTHYTTLKRLVRSGASFEAEP